MIETIVSWVGAAVVGALGIWAIILKRKAERIEKQMDDYQQSSDKWKIEAERRVEEAKRQAANKAPIDTKNRDDFK
jgi:hypothetical protein